MSTPPQFRDINKAANDLLTKVYPKTIGENSWGFEYELRPSSYVRSLAKIVNKGGVAAGTVESDIAFDDFGFTLNTKFGTVNPNLDLAVKLQNQHIEGATAKLHFNAQGGVKSSQTAGASVQYKHEGLVFNARVYAPVSKSLLNFVDEGALSDQDTKLDVNFVASHPDYRFFLGGATNISFATSKPGAERNIDNAQVSLGYRDGDLKSALSYKLSNKDGKESRTAGFSVYTRPGETAYVADVDYDLEDKKAVLTVGAQYPLSDGAQVKAKLDTNKNIGLAYINGFSRGTELQFGTLLSVDTSGDDIAIGSSFNFNLKFRQ
eukprot:Plantae.Rhodophyta-Palmaria_palmata.ctg7972.p1 GENE.Plantae.Rhodophyta-Palmaria_palmata.ctg7972~~Plantae.Rhodophyta-Palmaria_palmata.ctg7972.p1  ORF type:complete len:320 (-),score=47.81 Plantae.Rhodophyta-Palmaria_palmata.ctg7972:35-994(-)